jgi:hypothetical protein
MGTTQKQAVIDVVQATLPNFVPGMNAKSMLSDEQLKIIRETIIGGIRVGDIDYSKDATNERTVKNYVHGMVDNHLRKAKELNGGVKYAPATSRPRKEKDDTVVTVACDEKLAALQALKKRYTKDSDSYKKVVEAIGTYKIAKETVAQIDTASLPMELASFVEESAPTMGVDVLNKISR